MRLPNPILQRNSGYLQTDSLALQVFDLSRPESPFNPTAPSSAVPGPPAALPASHPTLRRAPGQRPARHQPLRVRGCRATQAAGSSATGHRDRHCALRRRPAQPRGFGDAAAGAGEGVWPAPRSPRPAHLEGGGGAAGRRAAPAGARGFGHLGARTRRDELGGSPRPRRRGGEPARGPHSRLLTPRASCRERAAPSPRLLPPSA